MARSIAFKGKTYILSGQDWYEEKTFKAPPLMVSIHLNELLASAEKKNEDHSTDAGALFKLASQYRDKGMFDRALELCSKVLQLDPGFEVGVAVIRSSIFRRQSEPDKALEVTEKFKTHKNAALQTTRAASFCDLGDWESAKKTIGLALAIGGSSKEEAFAVVNRIKASKPELYT